MGIRVYNSLSRKKEDFEPIHPPKVGMYVCGPTVYMESHIGHGVGPVIFDTVKRYLTFRGYDVTMVINVTDVDDKIIERARKLNTTVEDLVRRVEADYMQNIRKLGVVNVDHFPRATECIPQIIELVQKLIDRGHAYEAGGDVYFDVSSFPTYGKLSGRSVEEMEAGARIAPREHKRHPADFALWKASKAGEPAWDSPWGKGRPGWHIECSAMSMHYIGEELDIHGGGLDLIFPHHENEVAQSEAATGKPFVKYWMHNGLMQLAGDKMSKSKGNLVTITELLSEHSAELIRFLLLSTHYRRPIDFGPERIAEVNRGLQAFYRFFERFERVTGEAVYDVTAKLIGEEKVADDAPGVEVLKEAQRMRDEFIRAMDDDFNTAAAVASLFESLPAVNRFMDERGLDQGARASEAEREALQGFMATLRALGALLGIFEKPAVEPEALDELTTARLREIAAALIEKAGASTSGQELVERLIERRAAARKQKDFKTADEIREKLHGAGILLEDRAGGTTWSRST
ncbi:MAG: cysteinyl-tRNA synthetase [Planctomycetes bacterium DG_58]|nr:MAG: cysteinyl-tRNA synthetase [Planctomycetes bacterium DG_58]